MGTGSEEAEAMDKIIQEGIKREVERMQAEAARKAAEEAARNQGQNKMVADPEAAAPNWPDDGFQPVPQTGVDKVAGALRVGQAGDVAFARDLLNSGQAPLGKATAPDKSADGAKDPVSGFGQQAAKPALGL